MMPRYVITNTCTKCVHARVDIKIYMCVCVCIYISRHVIMNSSFIAKQTDFNELKVSF